MMFKKPTNSRIERTFNAEQREQVREAVVRWIESDQFENYFYEVHLRPEEALARCLSAALSLRGLLGIRGLWRKLRECGTGTSKLRQGYLELARTGQVVWGQALNTSADFRSGKTLRAKARVMACAEGTPVADKHSIETFYKFMNTLRSSSKSPAIAELRALANDVTFELFRVRQVPQSLAGKMPVHVFEIVLHRSTNPTHFKDSWAVVCLVNPATRPSLLAIPAEIAFRAVKGPPVQIRTDRSLSVP
jgi:hypothetical protein